MIRVFSVVRGIGTCVFRAIRGEEDRVFWVIGGATRTAAESA